MRKYKRPLSEEAKDILHSLRLHGPASPTELGERLGYSNDLILVKLLTLYSRSLVERRLTSTPNRWEYYDPTNPTATSPGQISN